MRDEVLVIIGKLPIMGFSKTRLAEDFNESISFDLYECFIKDFFTNYSSVSKLPLHFFGTPNKEETKKYFTDIFNSLNVKSFKFSFQKELSFFKRIESIFKEYTADKFIHLTGTDIPDFPFHHIKTNHSADVCIGPDSDGGYYYIGTKACNFKIFDLEESIKDGDLNVLEATISKCNELGLSYKLLPQWSDIDYKEDLKKCLFRSSRSKMKYTFNYLSKNKIVL